MLPLGRLGVTSLMLLAACRLEDHTPEGSRRDEAQIQQVIIEYYRSFSAGDWATCRKLFTHDGRVSYIVPAVGDSGASSVVMPADSLFLNWARLAQDSSFPSPEAQVLRTDFRQADGIAAVWVNVRQRAPVWENGRIVGRTMEGAEHWVLHRTGDGWRVVLLSLPWAPR